jgi:hypothetical protein
MVRWGFWAGRIESSIGATHRRLTTAKSVEYINRVFNDYLSFGALSAADLAGRDVLELGPGDNLGVALRFYAAGARRVYCLDKFFASRDIEQQCTIYRALRDTLSPAERRRYDDAIRLDNGISIDENCVKYVYGAAVEKAGTLLHGQSFDLIVSRAVLWEIYDIEGALQVLDQVLRPGGVQIHKIACLDWLFADRFHPLEFLTVNETLYRWMAQDSGKSNRRTIAYYRQAMVRLMYDYKLHVTRTVGMAGEEFAAGVHELVLGTHYSLEQLHLIKQIRPRLLERFQALSDEDLLVEDMFLVAQKRRSPGDRVNL